MNISVSVIMPAYNAEKYIFEAIYSVIKQSLTTWELIIINDGSLDNTESIIQQFNDSRIIFINIKENQGVSNARNVGLEHARGKYITFLDADDILPPYSLGVRSNYLDMHPESHIVDGNIEVKDSKMENIIKVYKPYYHGELLPRLIALDSRVFFGIVYMFRKDILDSIRFNKHMSHSEDLLFYIELSSRSSVNYSFVPETIYSYRYGHASAMANLEGLEKGYLLLLNEVNKIETVSIFQNFKLRLKITRILFLSWLRRKEFLLALKSIFITLNYFK